MSEDAAPQPERLEGAPHPRDTARLIGQDAAQQVFVDAFNTGRLHHAWMLTGPRGVGKATLAWQIARFLLATPAPDPDAMFADPPPETLDIPTDHPVSLRIASGGEGRIRNVTRTINPDTKKLRKEIVADDIRALNGFFQMSAPDGGYRVVIIDDADLMNTTAANALLKMLEEPPARALLILISHQPSGLLPTIRSRCRTLPLRTLDAGEVAQGECAGRQHRCARSTFGRLCGRGNAPFLAGWRGALCRTRVAAGHPSPHGPGPCPQAGRARRRARR